MVILGITDKLSWTSLGAFAQAFVMELCLNYSLAVDRIVVRIRIIARIQHRYCLIAELLIVGHTSLDLQNSMVFIMSLVREIERTEFEVWLDFRYLQCYFGQIG